MFPWKPPFHQRLKTYFPSFKGILALRVYNPLFRKNILPNSRLKFREFTDSSFLLLSCFLRVTSFHEMELGGELRVTLALEDLVRVPSSWLDPLSGTFLWAPGPRIV